MFNVGDYIQSVATKMFIQSDYCYVNREELDMLQSKEDVYIVMNGWFLHHSEHWPPSSAIKPLFVSFHITPNAQNQILSPKGVEYLKKYEPIGTRDLSTMWLLEKFDIKSYFSGCLTLTIGNFIHVARSGGGIYFVDPYFESGNNRNVSMPKILFNAIKYSIKYHSRLKFQVNFNCDKLIRIRHPFKRVGRRLLAASFYESYRLAFCDDILSNASYVSHSVFSSEYPSIKDKMQYAKSLIYDYSHAKLVVTSRIHCALPCLSMGVPVVFVTSKSLSEGRYRSANRFDGLLELLNVIEWTPNGFRGLSDSMINIFDNGCKITSSTKIINKDDYKELSARLIDAVTEFVKGQEST